MMNVEGRDTLKARGRRSLMSTQTDKLLLNLAKLETGVSKIYRYLSKQDHFTNPVKRFWIIMMHEELMHAKIFDKIRERVKADGSIQFEINIDMGQLKGFVEKVNKLLQEIKNREITESEAYSFGAYIEAQLDEANFTKKISTNNPEIEAKIEQIETETKKHRMILVNFSKGIR
jgi:hypothetical protein